MPINAATPIAPTAITAETNQRNHLSFVSTLVSCRSVLNSFRVKCLSFSITSPEYHCSLTFEDYNLKVEYMPKSELAPSLVTMRISCISPAENTQGRLGRGRSIMVKCDIGENPISTLVDEEKSKNRQFCCCLMKKVLRGRWYPAVQFQVIFNVS